MRTGGQAETPAPGTASYPGERLLVPDLARGAMLSLIAVANTHYWFRQDLDASGTVEGLVSGTLTLLVDARAYPLFALLLGFGLAILASRSVHEGLASGLDHGQAETRARALLRRRGLWLIAFGAVHALIFAQDILGVYGLITIMVAGVITARRWWAALLLAGAVCVSSTLFLVAVGADAALARNHGSAAQILFEQGPVGWATNLAMWIVVVPATVLTSMALPSALLGAWLAGRGWIERPRRYRRGLTVVFLVGLFLPVVVTPVVWAGVGGQAALERAFVAWHQGLAGVLAGAGYLAVIALAASRRAAATGVLGRALAATGRRTLSVYLAQTVLVALTAGALRLFGVDSLALAWQLLVAVTVWAVSLLACSLAERHGIPGPAERGLRRLVAANTRD
ncbi:DUF418 domain-containing protein [Nocardiopsis sp. SBT366]|uniref:DUF418 domain-containing protein n=1 Tax=Nocardiopsis sp. SBT366 TaxID=1580529 RepID=UPI000A5F374B|nr:DUF418 domain-containing protein [Nocardiopsis sp. SBT366]